MAAPTNVRTYATSQTNAVINWTYAGTAVIDVYRSTDGAAYTRITDNVTNVAVGTVTYTDTTLVAATKYWYKLSDDVGSTFSSVVTVYGHACLSPGGGDDTFILPRTNGEVPGKEFDDLAERIENAMNGQVLAPDQCAACPSDGRVVIDCSSGCRDWVMIADEDINSISIQWCGETDGKIEVIIPPNTSNRRICGWPGGFGFTGDECTQAPITTGSEGRSIGVSNGRGGRVDPGSSGSKPGYNRGIGTGGGGGGSACTCTPTGNGALTIKSCNANNSLNCSTTKRLMLLACGGLGPYTWSKTGTISLSKTTGAHTVVTPPTNAAPGTAGVAYKLYNKFTASAGGFCENWIANQEFSCNDVAGTCSTAADPADLPQTCGNGDITSINQLSCKGCSQTTAPCSGVHQCGASPDLGCNSASCAGLAAGGKLCDKRTAPMISAGCTPCGLNAGDTVSVTDSLGTVVTIILTA